MGASEQSNLVQSALLKTGGSNVSKKIRNAELDLLENGAWNNDIADLAPALLVAQPQWPKDWLLRITDLTESAAQTCDYGTERASIVYEIERIALPETGLPHYRVVKRGPAGKTIEAVPADGNCFFASVLNVLGEGGRRRLGIPSADNATQIIHLREMLAKHLVEHHTEYEPFVADVPPEVISEAAVIDWQPKNPDHFGIQIKAMPWYVNVLEHLSMEDLDLVDRIERIAFSQESRREIERWVRPLLTPMGGAERGEIQAAALVNFLKIADAAHDTYQIWPTEIAGRVFQTLAVVAHQTAPTERDAVMAAYQEIGNAYDRSPLLQHVVQYRSDHVEADIREFLTNRDAQVELMRVLDLADRHGDVALQLIVARLRERPQGSELMAILDSLVDEATERRIEAVAELREDFVGEGDPVPAMLAERLKSRLPGQSFGAVYDELGSSRTREALERYRDERVDEENNDWKLEGKELFQLAQQQMDGRSRPVVKPLRVRNAVEGAVAGLYALNPVPVLKFLEQAESGFVYLQTLAEYKDWKRDKAWRTLNDSIDAYDKWSANWQGETRFNWLRGQDSDLTDIEDSDRPILPGVNTETRNRQRREDTASGAAQHPPVDKQARGGRARMFAAAMDPESLAPYGWSALTEPLSLANGADGAGGSGGDEESGLLDRDTQASPTPEWMLAQLMAAGPGLYRLRGPIAKPLAAAVTLAVITYYGSEYVWDGVRAGGGVIGKYLWPSAVPYQAEQSSDDFNTTQSDLLDSLDLPAPERNFVEELEHVPAGPSYGNRTAWQAVLDLVREKGDSAFDDVKALLKQPGLAPVVEHFDAAEGVSQERAESLEDDRAKDELTDHRLKMRGLAAGAGSQNERSELERQTHSVKKRSVIPASQDAGRPAWRTRSSGQSAPIKLVPMPERGTPQSPKQSDEDIDLHDEVDTDLNQQIATWAVQRNRDWKRRDDGSWTDDKGKTFVPFNGHWFKVDSVSGSGYTMIREPDGGRGYVHLSRRANGAWAKVGSRFYAPSARRKNKASPKKTTPALPPTVDVTEVPAPATTAQSAQGNADEGRKPADDQATDHATRVAVDVATAELKANATLHTNAGRHGDLRLKDTSSNAAAGITLEPEALDPLMHTWAVEKGRVWQRGSEPWLWKSGARTYVEFNGRYYAARLERRFRKPLVTISKPANLGQPVEKIQIRGENEEQGVWAIIGRQFQQDALTASTAAPPAPETTASASTAEPSSSLTQAAAVWRSSSDLPVLLDSLRTALAKISADNQSIRTDLVYLLPKEGSPLHHDSKEIANQLRGLSRKIRHENNEKLNGAIGRLLLPLLKGIDLERPFSIVSSHHGTYSASLRIFGESKNGKAIEKLIPDPLLRLMDRTGSVHLYHPGGLAVRDDGAITLQSALAFYGVDVPAYAGEAEILHARGEMLPRIGAIRIWTDKKSARFAEMPEPLRLNLNTAEPLIIKSLDGDEGNTEDYEVIKDRINSTVQEIFGIYQGQQKNNTRFGVTREKIEEVQLEALKKTGVSMDLTVKDTDGEEDTYVLRHTARPSMDHYEEPNVIIFRDAAVDELYRYAVHQIREVEDEGDINIEHLTLKIGAPNFAERHYPLTAEHIRAFNIRALTPPFLFADPLANGTDSSIKKKLGDITQSLLAKEGRDSKILRDASERLLKDRGIDIGTCLPEEREKHLNDALDELLKVYYSSHGIILQDSQNLLIESVPSQTEFVAKEICKYFGVEENLWSKILSPSNSFYLSYKEGVENAGRLGVPYKTSTETMTLLNLFYDQDLRKKIGLAEDYDTVRTEVEEKVAKIFESYPPNLKENIDGIFDANLFFVGNGKIPDSLINPKESYSNYISEKILEKLKSYRQLEAERIVTTSPDALSRINASVTPSSTGINFEAVLTPAESDLLHLRAKRIEDVLRMRINNDDVGDMASEWSQTKQVMDKWLRLVATAIPELGPAFMLLIDAIEGNEEGVALDAMCMVAGYMMESEVAIVRTLGSLATLGSTAYTTEQQVEALIDAWKRKDGGEALLTFGNLMQTPHALLSSGATLVGSTKEMARAWANEDNFNWKKSHTGEQFAAQDLENQDGAALDAGEVPGENHEDIEKGPSERPYWRVNENGLVEPSSQKVVGADYHGNVITENAGKAIKIADPEGAIYMLNGGAYRLVTAGGGVRLQPLHIMDISSKWSPSLHEDGQSRFSKSSDGSTFPTDFAGLNVRSPDSGANTVPWFGNEELVPRSLSATGDGAASGELRLGVIEDKYVAENGGDLEVLEHAGVQGGKTSFRWADGSSFTVDRELPATPRYASNVNARIVAARGSAVVVEVSGMIDGLTCQKLVSGALATAKSGGGQEVIFRTDPHVYYRAKIPNDVALKLIPEEISSDQSPVEVAAEKISWRADPKLASPELYRVSSAYAETRAYDEFSLEYYLGMAAAENAYSRRPAWVEDALAALHAAKKSLPPEFFNVDNPFYALSTTPELAALFAPRNQARLADTLLSSLVRWGEISDPLDRAHAEDALKHITVRENGETTPLLAPDAALPSGAEEARTFLESARAKLNGNNLLVAEVETTNGERANFVEDRSGKVQVDEQFADICGGGIEASIESKFPDPKQIRSIRLFSLNELPTSHAERIFLGLSRGYPYESVATLEKPAEKTPGRWGRFDIPAGEYPDQMGAVKIQSAADDLRGAHRIDDEGDPKNGAYLVTTSSGGGRYYVKLDNNMIYRAIWDRSAGAFRLISPEDPGGIETPGAGYSQNPIVRHLGGGDFTLANRPGLFGGGRDTVVYAADDPQRIWSRDYWVKRAEDAGAKNVHNKVVAQKYLEKYKWVKSKEKFDENKIIESYKKLIINLDEEARSAQADEGQSSAPIKVYRAAEEPEVNAAVEWSSSSYKADMEAAVRCNDIEAINKLRHAKEVSPISGHLGDSGQAIGYNGRVMEITLKPGSEKYLFSPDYMALSKGDSVTAAALANLYAKEGRFFKEGSGSEGNKPGYIGLKSEKGGPFSLSVGDGYSKLLFQLFIDKIEIARQSTRKNDPLDVNIGASTSHDRGKRSVPQNGLPVEKENVAPYMPGAEAPPLKRSRLGRAPEQSPEAQAHFEQRRHMRALAFATTQHREPKGPSSQRQHLEPVLER